MAYKKSNMVYSDYHWKAKDDHDDPNFIHKPDSTELNRTEGYEMLYFINYCAQKWKWGGENISSMQKLEKTIRTKVPSSIRNHTAIRLWIEVHFKDFWDDI